MRGQLRRAATLLALAGAAACGPRPGSGPAAAPPVMVRVVNQNRADINLYVLRGGTRTRMGTVVAGDTRIIPLLHLPAAPVHQLGFEVQRIGAEGVYALPRVSVSPGQSVHIRVQELITTSEIAVYEDDTPASGKPLP
ncbi:MAG TPA: hypothetical protein VGO40_00270 [Longimicrobium sp.]|jgi:hypothetical protein|nr:hypothetical protein [Longimicrobium sp.]